MIAAIRVGMNVERFSLFFPPYIFKRKIRGVEYALGSIPLGGACKISGMNPEEELADDIKHKAYHRLAPWRRIVVILAGPAVNLVIAFVLLMVYFTMIGQENITSKVAKTEANSPAAMILKPGDRIISVDGVRGDATRLSKQVATHTCAGKPTDGCAATTPARVSFEREGREQTVSITPVYDAAPDAKRMRVGFVYAFERETVGVIRALDISKDQFWLMTRETAKIPLKVFDKQERKELGSVVGAYETTRQSIIEDIADAVAILAIISLALALINLLPCLPLDGGWIILSALEKIRKKPISLKTMERFSIVGFVLILILFSIGLMNDIDRLQNGGFGFR